MYWNTEVSTRHNVLQKHTYTQSAVSWNRPSSYVFKLKWFTRQSFEIIQNETGPTKSRPELSGRRLDSGTVQTPSRTVRLQSGAVWTWIRVVCHVKECRSTVLHAIGLLTVFRVTKVMSCNARYCCRNSVRLSVCLSADTWRREYCDKTKLMTADILIPQETVITLV